MNFPFLQYTDSEHDVIYAKHRYSMKLLTWILADCIPKKMKRDNALLSVYHSLNMNNFTVAICFQNIELIYHTNTKTKLRVIILWKHKCLKICWLTQEEHT